MNNHIVSDMAVVIDGYMRMDQAILTDPGEMTDKYARLYNGSNAYFRRITDKRFRLMKTVEMPDDAIEVPERIL